jgi:hypothetical protein
MQGFQSYQSGSFLDQKHGPCNTSDHKSQRSSLTKGLWAWYRSSIHRNDFMSKRTLDETCTQSPFKERMQGFQLVNCLENPVAMLFEVCQSK